ncbi:MAG: biosynthetic arginine decarboxylase [Myxococcales bacterium]|nr:biosynthetic arginine decarboxylase [Myxococcales bacterium]MCB9694669.1 biosynthetic arginine decarboxylase [Alphaproteobacteria bacterium]
MSWTTQDSTALYNIHGWGRNLFEVDAKGFLNVRPAGPEGGAVNLYALMDDLVVRGIELPQLIRFPQVAARRLSLMREAFAAAATHNDYKGRYRPVYPIKVNQQADLVRDVVEAGGPHGLGLECGSKPELLICMALLENPESLLVCNGYKDASYIRLALSAQKLGRKVIIVIEKLSEIDTVLACAKELGVRPTLGLRARLSRPGAGRWKKSSGDRAKFGLSAGGILRAVRQLQKADFLDCLKLLHFHIGSQVSNIRTFKRAFREGTRLYTELAKLGAPMGMFDVGGGVGVDYDGSRTDFDSSMNYSMREYALDVVSFIAEACDAEGLAHPDIITESGRATVAHCSVLLFDIVGKESLMGPVPPATEEDSDVVNELRELYDKVTVKNYVEAWHDARDARERARQAFELGVETLVSLGRAEQLFWAVCGKIAGILNTAKYIPDDLALLPIALADTYYGNFSLFQSVPDSWAIEQLFPVLPIHRLDEEPTERAVIADLTCDSDGRIDRFVNQRDIKRTLEVHALKKGERYVLAVCLVGAYQEILGDLHNLFGDTNAVHVRVDEGSVEVERVVDGDSVENVLGYVQYDRKDLVHRLRQTAERAIKVGLVSRDEAADVVRLFRTSLDSYTYLSA